MKKLFLPVLLLILSIQGFAQIHHYVYEQNINEKLSSEYHVLLLNEDYALAYNEFHFVEKNDSSLLDRHASIDIFDRASKQFKQITLFHTDRLSPEFLSNISKVVWKSMKKDRLTLYDDIQDALEFVKSDYAPFPEENCKVKLTKEYKQIGEFNCQKALVTAYGEEFEVWFAPDMKMNWFHLDYLYNVPGLVVEVYREGKCVTKLQDKGELKYEDIALSQANIIEILLSLM